MILDLENLPSCPCKTQCPECQQFITTETVTSVSSVTWLVCFMTALVGYETFPYILLNDLHKNIIRLCWACLYFCIPYYSYSHMLPGLLIWCCSCSFFCSCVAGCCLIPFCLDRFKSTTHRCPKCRSSIKTIKKLWAGGEKAEAHTERTSGTDLMVK